MTGEANDWLERARRRLREIGWDPWFDPARIYGWDEAARIVGVDVKKLRRLVHSGIVRHIRHPGRRISFSGMHLFEFVCLLADKRTREAHPTSVYVIGIAGKKRPVKIGCGRAMDRLRSLQTGNHELLELRACWPFESKAAAAQAETELHRQLRTQRVVGEWFDVSVDEVTPRVQYPEELER